MLFPPAFSPNKQKDPPVKTIRRKGSNALQLTVILVDSVVFSTATGTILLIRCYFSIYIIV